MAIEMFNVEQAAVWRFQGVGGCNGMKTSRNGKFFGIEGIASEMLMYGGASGIIE